MRPRLLSSTLVLCVAGLAGCGSFPLDPQDAGGGSSGGGTGGGGSSGGGPGGGGGHEQPDAAPGNPDICGSGAATDGVAGRIAFDSDRDNFNRDIYLVRADGSGLTRLT